MLLSNSGSRQGRKRVLVADDHPIVRRGVRAFVEALGTFEVVGDAGGLDTVVERAEQVAPDIVVMDLSMSRLQGVDKIVQLRRRLPGVEVLVFTLHQSEQLFMRAIEAGARGFVCKAESEHLIPALEAVARRESYFCPSMRDVLGRRSRDVAGECRPLTRREEQVVTLAALGQSNKAISRELQISVKTTETHRAAAMRKTGTNSIVELTLYAARNGMLEL